MLYGSDLSLLDSLKISDPRFGGTTHCLTIRFCLRLLQETSTPMTTPIGESVAEKAEIFPQVFVCGKTHAMFMTFCLRQFSFFLFI